MCKNQASIEFSLLKRFIELELTEDKGVPTETFLNCCSDIFSLFDNFGSTTFLPVKIDVYGNINVRKCL